MNHDASTHLYCCGWTAEVFVKLALNQSGVKVIKGRQRFFSKHFECDVSSEKKTLRWFRSNTRGVSETHFNSAPRFLWNPEFDEKTSCETVVFGSSGSGRGPFWWANGWHNEQYAEQSHCSILVENFRRVSGYLRLQFYLKNANHADLWTCGFQNLSTRPYMHWNNETDRNLETTHQIYDSLSIYIHFPRPACMDPWTNLRPKPRCSMGLVYLPTFTPKTTQFCR